MPGPLLLAVGMMAPPLMCVQALRCMVVAQTLDPDYPTVTKVMPLLRQKMGGHAVPQGGAVRIIEMRGRYHDGRPLDAEQLERILCEGL